LEECAYRPVEWGPAAEPDAEIYMPYEQHPNLSTSLRIIAGTELPPANLFETFRRRAHAISPEMPVKFTTMEARLSENVAPSLFRTLLLSIFAGVAIGLAVAGIYAVTSFAVHQRVNEIGLRMALGAASHDVVKMVLAEGVRMAIAGLALGLGGAILITRLISTMLFNVKPTDAIAYSATVALVMAVTVLAAYFPARRAARVNPSVALRHE
jgi:ABC-type antimicrobial peptide transport system permease subunit